MGTAPLQANDPERMGAYRLTGRLGEGGQGVVYLGEDAQGQKVAVKLLHARFSGDAKMRARFAGELSSAKRVAPFCTAKILDADVDGEIPYLVSEYIEGLSLRGVVDKEGPRGGSSLQRLAIGTVTALAAIHEAGIVHRDFKPTNVLLASDGPRVIDFGIARALDASGTVSSTTVGTPSYMSPEQISGEHVGPASDVFAWGCTMAYASTGAPPFGQDSIPAVMNRILHQEPGLGTLSGTLREIVGACLSKDPRRRPTAQQILVRLLSAEGVVLPSAGPGTMLGRGAQVASEVTPTGRTIDPPRPATPRPGGDTPPPGVLTGPGGNTPPPRRRRRRSGLLVGTTVAVVLLVTAGTYAVVRMSGRVERVSAAGQVGGTFRMAATSVPQHIDPSNAVRAQEVFAAESLFTGLRQIQPGGGTRPALATRTTSDASCRKWSFTIRQGTRFSDGQPVDAAAFARGWNRAAQGGNAVDLMGGIRGYADVVSRKATTMKGVTTEGVGLLKVTLTKPDCDFGDHVAAPVFSPVPPNAGGPTDPAYDRLPIGNGPYKIRQYVPGRRLILVRNDSYAFAKPKLDAVDISYIANVNQALASFETGRYDWVELQPETVPRALARHASDGRLIKTPIDAMTFLLPIDDNGPMASKDARLAVSYALDRRQLIRTTQQGIYPPATSIVPPAIHGALAGGCASCAGDPARAKSLAAKAGLGPGSRVTFSLPDSTAQLGDAVKARLTSVLGWDVRIRKLKPTVLSADQASADAQGLYPYFLLIDYPDAGLFLYTSLSSDSIQRDASGSAFGSNLARYSSPAFDKAIDDARATRNPGQRLQRVRAAEKIALDDMALIPLYSHVLYRLADTKAFVNVGSDYLGYPTLLTTARK